MCTLYYHKSVVVSVKYLREVTPYFRKASIISEVGWELQRGFLSGAPPVVKFPQRADTRYLPLQLCHLARNFRYPDPGQYRIHFLLKLLVCVQHTAAWLILTAGIDILARNAVYIVRKLLSLITLYGSTEVISD